ncbi:hypothetical protein ACHAXR_007206 [Thalassiosira sp. AJA248-18]
MNRSDDFEEVLISGQSLVNRAGNFSLTFKLPRNGKKSMVLITNEMKNFCTWCQTVSSRSNSLIRNQDHRCILKRLHENASDEEKMAYERMVKVEKRILGVHFYGNGDSSPTGTKLIAKITTRLKTSIYLHR